MKRFLIALFLAVSTNAQDAFVTGAQSAANSTVQVARYFAIIVLALCGLSFAVDHERGVMGRIITMIVCLVFALGAGPIVSTIQNWA